MVFYTAWNSPWVQNTHSGPYVLRLCQILFKTSSISSKILYIVSSNIFFCQSLLTAKKKQIRRIVVPRAATNFTLKKVKGQGQGQGHGMVPIERVCHKDHACQIPMLYL